MHKGRASKSGTMGCALRIFFWVSSLNRVVKKYPRAAAKRDLSPFEYRSEFFRDFDCVKGCRTCAECSVPTGSRYTRRSEKGSTNSFDF
jgi:hypothetical protein